MFIADIYIYIIIYIYIGLLCGNWAQQSSSAAAASDRSMRSVSPHQLPCAFDVGKSHYSYGSCQPQLKVGLKSQLRQQEQWCQRIACSNQHKDNLSIPRPWVHVWDPGAPSVPQMPTLAAKINPGQFCKSIGHLWFSQQETVRWEFVQSKEPILRNWLPQNYVASAPQRCKFESN